MEKLTYETPQTEIIRFDEDIITTSGEENETDPSPISLFL